MELQQESGQLSSAELLFPLLIREVAKGQVRSQQKSLYKQQMGEPTLGFLRPTTTSTNKLRLKHKVNKECKRFRDITRCQSSRCMDNDLQKSYFNFCYRSNVFACLFKFKEPKRQKAFHCQQQFPDFLQLERGELALGKKINRGVPAFWKTTGRDKPSAIQRRNMNGLTDYGLMKMQKKVVKGQQLKLRRYQSEVLTKVHPKNYCMQMRIRRGL